jgi:hypothetical protein
LQGRHDPARVLRHYELVAVVSVYIPKRLDVGGGQGAVGLLAPAAEVVVG